MQIETHVLGGLRCRLLCGVAPFLGSPGDEARPEMTMALNPSTTPCSAASLRFAVILCHGYGAPGDDLVSLAAEVCRAAPSLEQRLRFVFPEAPIAMSALGPWDSRAWWPLDESLLDAAITRDSPIETVRAVPAELPALRESMRGLLADIERTEGIPISRVVLGGFSQGAMLATDVALRLPVSPAGLVVFSGTLLDADNWGRLAPTRRGMPALLSHGRQDTLLSYRTAEGLRDLLAAAGVAVEFVPFDGPHTISSEGFTAFVALLRRLAGC